MSDSHLVTIALGSINLALWSVVDLDWPHLLIHCHTNSFLLTQTAKNLFQKTTIWNILPKVCMVLDTWRSGLVFFHCIDMHSWRQWWYTLQIHIAKAKMGRVLIVEATLPSKSQARFDSHKVAGCVLYAELCTPLYILYHRAHTEYYILLYWKKMYMATSLMFFCSSASNKKLLTKVLEERVSTG